jgi:hypothetical protein
VASELALNGSLTVLGLACSSLVPWHGFKRAQGGKEGGLAGAIARALTSTLTGRLATGHPSTTRPLESSSHPSARGLPRGQGGGGATAQKSFAAPSWALYEPLVARAVGCWLANALAFALVALAFAAAARRPALLDRCVEPRCFRTPTRVVPTISRGGLDATSTPMYS